MDWATNNANHHPSLVHAGDVSTPLRWREPDQVLKDENMVSHDVVEIFCGLLIGHKGCLGDRLLNPKNQAELQALCPGVEDLDLHRLLNETQICKEMCTEPRNYSWSAPLKPASRETLHA